MEQFRNRFGISGSTLKIIAIISMAIDHFAASFLYRGIMTLPSVAANADLMHVLPYKKSKKICPAPFSVRLNLRNSF